MKYKKSFKITTIALSVAISFSPFHAGAAYLQDIRLGGYIIPGVFGQALQEGMNVPVFLLFRGGDSKNKQKIADARIALDNGHLIIQDLSLIDTQNGAILQRELLESLAAMRDSEFDKNNKIIISPDADLKLNLPAFFLSLNVNEKGLDTSFSQRHTILKGSSVHKISSVLNYDLGVYRNQRRKNGSTSNNYLNLDQTIAFSEHHFNVNGSLYGMGNSQGEGQIYRAMYEHDVNSRRLAIGLLDTWNLQSLGSLSALNGSKIYGISYGSHSSTKISNNQYSLTSVTVFLPSAGEVHIYRDGKLLSIQNYAMGSFEVDTSKLPFGVYDVDIEVVIDGQVRSKKREKINKLFSSKNSDGLEWQLFGGYVDYKRQYYERPDDKDNNHTAQDRDTYLTGISASTTLPVLSGLTLQTTAYSFDQHYINESAAMLTLGQYGTLGWQSLVSEAGKYRNIFNASANLPYNMGYVWVNREKSHINNRLPVYDTDTYSYGGTLTLNQFWNHAGSLTLGHTMDKREHNTSNNFEYSTALYSGRYGAVNLRTGVQRYQYDYHSSSTSERYVSLDFTLPLATWLSAGGSSSNGDTRLNLAANHSFDDSVISSAGGSVSKSISGQKNNASDYAASGYMAFDSKYSTGTLSLSRPDSQSLNGNMTAHGSMAYSDNTFAASGIQEKSGVIIKTGLKDDAKLSAKVNGRNYDLTRNNTFIPLPSYSSYVVELMNDKNSMDSFDILSGKTRDVTLYPGNVEVYKPEIKQLVTVFGRITGADGKLLANTPIRNHIGRTVTDSNGEFSMDVDKRYPVISMANGDRICEADLDLAKAHGVKWVGSVVCEPQTVLAKR